MKELIPFLNRFDKYLFKVENQEVTTLLILFGIFIALTLEWYILTGCFVNLKNTL